MRKAYCTLGYACNQRCLLCAIGKKRLGVNWKLPLEKTKKFFHKVNLQSGDTMEFSGGEPMMYENIEELCKYFSENFDAELIMLSNAQKFSDFSFAKVIAKAGINRVVTALYSSKADVHDFITQQRGSFARTIKGLKNLEKLDVAISIKTIVTKLNYKELPQFIEFCFSNFKDPWVSIHGLEIRGLAKKNWKILAVKYSETSPHIETAVDKAKELGKHVSLFAMPMCTFDPIYWDNFGVESQKLAKGLEFIAPERQGKDVLSGFQERRHRCYGCLLFKRCFWPMKYYTKIFGVKEFNPIKKNVP